MKHYTTTEIKNILDMRYNKRMKFDAIAEAIGRTPKSVEDACHRHKNRFPEFKFTAPIRTSKKNQEKIEELLKRSEEVEVATEEMQIAADSALENFYGKQYKPTPTMTPREMIKHLYTLGYRIKNNELVVLVEQKVNIKDIIHG